MNILSTLLSDARLQSLNVSLVYKEASMLYTAAKMCRKTNIDMERMPKTIKASLFAGSIPNWLTTKTTLVDQEVFQVKPRGNKPWRQKADLSVTLTLKIPAVTSSAA